MIIGIDHGYYAIKTKQVCFPTGIIRYEYEPYTMQNVLQYRGEYYVCGTGRQTLVKDKTANDNYYLLTLAALAQEIRKRKGERTAKVVLAAGLPLTGFGREKQKNKEKYDLHCRRGCSRSAGRRNRNCRRFYACKA